MVTFKELDPLFGAVLFILLLLAGFYLLSLTRDHKDTLQFQVKLFCSSFLVRYIAAIAIYQFGLVQVLGDEDASGWYNGVTLLKEWEQQRLWVVDLPAELLNAFDGNHLGYRYLLGTLFYITDSPGRMPAAVLNCFTGALTVVIAYRIARCLFPDRVAARVGWFACFFPSMIIWSAQTVKEPIVILLESLALYGCVRLKISGFSLKHAALCAAAIILLLPFRFYAAYLAAATIAFSLAMPRLRRGKSSLRSTIGIAAFLVPLVFASGLLARREAQFSNLGIERVEKFKGDVTQGTGSGSGVKQNFNLRNPFEFVLAVGFGGAHLLLAPFPWQLGGASLRMALTLPELLVWWYLFFSGVVPGFWFGIRKRFSDIQPLLFFTLGLGLLYSLMFGNIGLIYRQRAQLLPWLLIFAAVGLELRRRGRLESQRVHMSHPLLASSRR